MGRYIKWDDVSGRYPEMAKIDATDAASSHIPYAENEVDARLSGSYTVPFSSNNITAKDLAIDHVMMRYWMLRNKEKYDLIHDMLDERIKRLSSGAEAMITTSGDTVGFIGDMVYSTTMNYKPTFTMADDLITHVDSSRQLNEQDSYLG